jgi:hypothetical protein
VLDEYLFLVGRELSLALVLKLLRHDCLDVVCKGKRRGGESVIISDEK